MIAANQATKSLTFSLVVMVMTFAGVVKAEILQQRWE